MKLLQLGYNGEINLIARLFMGPNHLYMFFFRLSQTINIIRHILNNKCRKITITELSHDFLNQQE